MLRTICLYSVCVLAALTAATGAEADYFVYVGSYTDAPSHSKGIYAWRFEPVIRQGHAAWPGGRNGQSRVCVRNAGRTFSLCRKLADGRGRQGRYGQRLCDRQKTGALTLLNRVSAGGGLPNQVIVDPQGKFVMVTNYGFHGNDAEHNNSSLAALPIQADGRLGEPFYVDHHAGAALSPRQTTGAHTHGVIFTKDDRLAYVTELGLDRVYVYHVDATKIAVKAADPPFVSVSAGSGPRRLALSPSEKFLYVNHETDSKVSVFAADRGTLQEIQQISTLTGGLRGAEFHGRNPDRSRRAGSCTSRTEAQTVSPCMRLTPAKGL